ncbi:major tail protein [Mycobacterium phage DarthPhader]|uniref:Major tail protein n=1 Tax=Mycobacterium phage DarthPhader TaxID=1912975 RepID=A0A1I9S3X0_9CAUD|nr:major tail protein [Mycobacterium phage DarthPhader]AOZ61264.1 major tail protein [Mycobacterium phage DarthPhader]
MAENDDAVLTAAVGYVYTGLPGTQAPTPSALKTIDLSKPETWAAGATGWTSVGHTSRGTLPEFGFEGGDSEVKGSWQKKKLREITSEDPIDYLTIVLHQFDEDALSLYYGENASTTPGVFGYDGKGGTNERAVLVVIEDGDLRLGHHASKSSVKRDDSIELPIDDLAALPVRFTYLDFEDELLFTWINEDLFNVEETP